MTNKEHKYKLNGYISFDEILEFIYSFEHRKKPEKKQWILERSIETRYIREIGDKRVKDIYDFLLSYWKYKNKSIWWICMKINHWRIWYIEDIKKYLHRIEKAKNTWSYAFIKNSKLPF